ncbi:protein kinase [Streptomyces sp. NPDC006285]|uniref:protein kinase domain-containing protein n=1 Tax=Streptomyces sp. NPDC006285 TaxID=3364742 RepID=UPI00369023BB
MRDTVLDGRYTLTERIGAGGMGVVWRARDARLDRQVAVKLLSLPPDTEGGRERLLAMFGREARAAAALDSSYIVPVFDHGTDGEVPYLVMPLLSGRTLRELLAEGLPAPERVAVLAAQVCRALATAHRAGVVHRDIKPANVMVTDEGMVKVLDFGIATFLDATTDGRLTSTTDSPVGTLLYMAPERFTRGADDGRTDVYALGCTVYEMLTGAPPFDSASAPALMHSHVYETPQRPSARRPGLAPEWDELVGRMLAKPVAERPTAEQARETLDRLTLPASARAASGGPARTSPEQRDSVPAPPARELAADAAAPGHHTTSYLLAPPRPRQPPTAPPPARRRGRRLVWAGAPAVAAALVAALLVVQSFGGDDGGSGESGPRGAKGGTVARVAKTETLTLGSAADSKGPAPAVRGADRGGTVTVLEPGNISTVDPGNSWSGGERVISRLVHRSLTALKTLPDGSVRLVGDGVATHHLMPQGMPGSRDFDLYGAGAHGDPAAARALLAEAGETDYPLTLAHATAADEARAKAVKKGLDRAGFRVTLKNVDVSDLYENVAKGEYDLVRLPMNMSGLPLASAYLPDSFDGRHTYPTTNNFSRLDSAAVDSAIDEANATADVAAAGEKWSTVDRRVMEQAAAVPVYVPVRTFLHSSRLKGLQVDLDGLSPLNAYVSD